MSRAEDDLAAAEADARQARALLTGTLVDLQARLHPRALVREAIDEVRDAGHELLRAGVAAAKRNPTPLIAVAGTLVALVARYWIVGTQENAGDPATEPQAPRLQREDNDPPEGKPDD